VVEVAELSGLASEEAFYLLPIPDLDLTGLVLAGIVLGARVPIVLTSRADTVQTRFASCAVALLLAYHRRKKGA